jgi:hypothetical protein
MSVVAQIEEKLLSVLGEVGSVLKILFEDTIQQELQVVIPLATKIVAEIAADPTLVTSDQKRNAALAGIGADLLASQKQIAPSIISLAVELAVQNLPKPTPTA